MNPYRWPEPRPEPDPFPEPPKTPPPPVTPLPRRPRPSLGIERLGRSGTLSGGPG